MSNDCNTTNVNFSDPTLDFDKLLENCSFNGGNQNFPKHPTGPDRDAETAFKLLFYILTAVGNVLLLYVIYKDPLKRFRNTPSYLIASFTIADLVSIISGICDSIFLLNPQKAQENHEIAGCFAAIGIQSSFLTIMTFAMERYVALAHPYKYQNIMRRKSVMAVLILLPWCFAIVALPVVYFHPQFKHGKTLTNLFAGDIIALTGISLIVHPVTHWTFTKKIKHIAVSSNANKHMLAENLKVARILATTVLLVSICLITFMLPYFVAFCFNLAGCDECFLNNAFLSFWKYYPLLTAIRLMTNSLVYAWRMPLYRESLKVLVRSCQRHLQTNIMPRSRTDGSISAGNTSTTLDQTPSFMHLTAEEHFSGWGEGKNVSSKNTEQDESPRQPASNDIQMANNIYRRKETTSDENG